jgi:HAD superfamily hydrolase (TIGR01549 family)
MPAQTGVRWVCLDVGETLIDETRIWSVWADVLGIPRLTFMAAFGAVLARGGDHRDVALMLGRPDWQELGGEGEKRFGGFKRDDLYPDALSTLDALRVAGYRTAIFANQPAQRTAQLHKLGINPDLMAMSAQWGVHKPMPEFFARALREMDAAAADVIYVGDRLDYDIRPAAAAGLRPVWVRRGPWGVIIHEDPPAGTLMVNSLAEFVARIDEVWQ